MRQPSSLSALQRLRHSCSKIKGMLSSMTADLTSMNSDSSGSATTGMPTPIIPFRRPATIRLQTTAATIACLLENKGADQHDVQFLEINIPCSAFAPVSGSIGGNRDA